MQVSCVELNVRSARHLCTTHALRAGLSSARLATHAHSPLQRPEATHP